MEKVKADFAPEGYTAVFNGPEGHCTNCAFNINGWCHYGVPTCYDSAREDGRAVIYIKKPIEINKQYAKYIESGCDLSFKETLRSVAYCILLFAIIYGIVEACYLAVWSDWL